MCEKFGVEFCLGTEVTPELIGDEMPDAVVLATGPVYAPLPSAGQESQKVVGVLDVLSGKAQVGDKVVVWGNRKPGIGVALYLAKQGKKVTIVGKEKSAGFDVNPSFKWRYMIYLRQNKVSAYNDCDIVEVGGDELLVRTFDGYHFPLKYDTIVLTERRPNEDLKAAVQGEGIQMYVVGDALMPRNLSSAVHDGYRIGLRI
jgi:2,4-dienoyl-CoA reductase (NADPH2)